jgi:hypothetical protein
MFGNALSRFLTALALLLNPMAGIDSGAFPDPDGGSR